MFLIRPIQFCVIIAFIAPVIGASMIDTLGPNRDVCVKVLLADAALASEQIDTIPDDPSDDDILLNVAVWPPWHGPDTWDIGDSPSTCVTARHNQQGRGPPIQYIA